ncbi:MAG: right-handed parallel beta-helix repeat-containing protein [Thermoplasmata archaeon]
MDIELRRNPNKKNYRTGVTIFLTALMVLVALLPASSIAEEGTGMLTVYGEVTDDYGLPTDRFLVGYENLRSMTGDVSEFQDGEYYLEIADAQIGDVISLNFTDGKCFSSESITIDSLDAEKQIDIILDPPKDKPKPCKFDKPNLDRIKKAMEPLKNKIEVSTEDDIPFKDDEDEGNETNETEPPILLTDIRSPPLYRNVFTNKTNFLKFTLKNNETKRYVVKAVLYDLKPDGETKEYLKTIHFGVIRPGQEKTRRLPRGWGPTERGFHWIYGEIFVLERKDRCGVFWNLTNEFEERFRALPGERPIMHIPGDWVIDEPTTIDYRTIIVDGDTYVNESLIITNSGVIGDNLIVNYEFPVPSPDGWDMNCQQNGEFKVEVKSSGHLIAQYPLFNGDTNIYYNFWMNGSLTIDKHPLEDEPGSISEVNGDPNDLSAPGGIICNDPAGTITITDGGNITNCRSHGLYLNNTAATLDDANISHCGGYGLYAVKSDPVIANSMFYNNSHGAHFTNCFGGQVDPGKPDYIPGEDLGYYIWYDETQIFPWIIKWSTDGEEHHFTGTITYDSTTYTIDSLISSGDDGFAFDAERVTFDLLIDGERIKEQVYIGDIGRNPDDIPFTLTKPTKSVEISSSKALGCTQGIYLENSSVRIDSNSNLQNNSRGLYLSKRSTAFVDSSNINGNSVTGIYLENGSFVNANNNYIANNGGGPTPGHKIPTPMTGIKGVDSWINVTSNVFNEISTISTVNSSGYISDNVLLIPYWEVFEATAPVSCTGITISSSKNLRIENNLLFGGGGTWHAYGIRVVKDSRDIFIHNNTITSRGIHDFEFRGSIYTLYRIDDILKVLIDGTNIYEYTTASQQMEKGILVSQSKNITIYNSIINNTEIGFYVEPGSLTYLENNKVNGIGQSEQTYYGVFGEKSEIYMSRNNNISNNYIGVYLTNCTGKIGYGDEPDNSKIVQPWQGIDIGIPAEANNITVNRYGIYLYNSTNTVINNIITGLTEPISLEKDVLNPAGIVIQDCNNENVRVENNIGSSPVFIYVDNSTANLTANKFYIYSTLLEGYEVAHVGIEGIDSILNITENKFYGIHPGTEAGEDFIVSAIKLFNCNHTTLKSNELMPSNILGPEGHPIMIGLYTSNTTAALINNTIGNADTKGTYHGVVSVNESKLTMNWNNITEIRSEGIYTEDSTLFMENTTIADIGDHSYDGYGIYSFNSSLYLKENNITEINHMAMYTENSSVSILKGNNITETSGYGLYSVNCTNDVENSTFYHQLNWSIWVTNALDRCKIAYNLIDNNSHGIYYGNSDITAEIEWNTVSNHTQFEVETIQLDQQTETRIIPIGYGLYINSTKAFVENNTMKYSAYNVFFINSEGKIRQNVFEDNLYDLTVPIGWNAPKGGECIVIEKSNNIDIIENTISEANRAFTGKLTDSISITDCTAQDVYYGASFKDSTYLEVKDNVIEGIPGEGTIGLNLRDLSGAFTYNTISYFKIGVRIWTVENIDISHNYITHNNFGSGYGIEILGEITTPASSIDRNQISDNNVGLYVSSIIPDGVIRSNNIEDNLDYGAFNSKSSYYVDMQYNWWGDQSGPAPIGSGNPVNEYIDASNPLQDPVTV